MAILTAADIGRDNRQLHILDAMGRVGQHTGERCVPWAGHIAGDDVSVAGNMLVGPQVVAETLQAYKKSEGKPFGDRLIGALEAGQDAGGDKRGKQSAAIKIWSTEPYPLLDLRTDDDATPLIELRRLYELAKERYLPTTATMATRANPAGIFDDAARDLVMNEYRQTEGPF